MFGINRGVMTQWNCTYDHAYLFFFVMWQEELEKGEDLVDVVSVQSKLL